MPAGQPALWPQLRNSTSSMLRIGRGMACLLKCQETLVAFCTGKSRAELGGFSLFLIAMATVGTTAWLGHNPAQPIEEGDAAFTARQRTVEFCHRARIFLIVIDEGANDTGEQDRETLGADHALRAGAGYTRRSQH